MSETVVPSERFKIARGSVASIVDNLLKLSVALVAFPFLLHAVGPTNYGIYILVASLSGYLGFLDLGLGPAVVKHISAAFARKESVVFSRLLTSALVASLIVGAVASILATIAAFLLPAALNLTTAERELTRVLLLFLALGLAFGFAQSLWLNTLAGMQAFVTVAYIGMMDTILRAVVAVVIVTQGGSVLDLAFLTLLVSQVAPIISAFVVSKRENATSISSSGLNRDNLLSLFKFGGVISLMNLVAIFIYPTDALLLGVLTSSSALALYAVAQKFNTLLRHLVNLLPSIVMPVSSAYNETGESKRLKALIVEGSLYSNMLIAPLTMIIIVMAGPIVTFWVGSDLGPSTLMVQVYVFYIIFYSTEAFVWKAITGSSRLARLLPFVVTLAALNLILSIGLTISFGPIGVVLGTTLSSTLLHPWYLRVAMGEVGIPVGYFVRSVYLKTLPTSITMAALLYLVARLFPPIDLLTTVAYCLAFYVGSIAALFAIGLGETDRQRIRATIRLVLDRP